MCDTSDENAQRGVLPYDVTTPIDILFIFPLSSPLLFPAPGVSLNLEEITGQRPGILWISYEGFQRTRTGPLMGHPSLPCLPCKLTLPRSLRSPTPPPSPTSLLSP